MMPEFVTRMLMGTCLRAWVHDDSPEKATMWKRFLSRSLNHFSPYV